MKHFVRISLKNICRRPNRSMITTIAIFISVIGLLVAQGFVNGIHYGLIDKISHSRTGDIQINHKNYLKTLDTLSLKWTISNPSLIEKLLLENPNLQYTSTRLIFGGMISNGNNSPMVIGMGVSINNELKVCPYILENISEGRIIKDNALNEALITSKLAENTGTNIGDTLLLLAHTKEGELNAIEVNIVGFLTDRLPLANNNLLYLNIKSAQELLRMPNQVTQIIARTHDSENAKYIINELYRLLNNETLKYTITSWDMIEKFYKDSMDMVDAVLWVIKLIILIIVVSSIVNIMLMTVFERMREIGTLRALGMQQKDIITLYITEAIIIGVIGGSVGLFSSYLIILYFSINGFTYIAPGTYYPFTIFPFITIFDVFFAIFFSIFSSLLAAAYPAWKASRLEPSDALRSIW